MDSCKIQKHSFLLLELLIALFLLTTTILPFAYLPIKALQKEYLSFQDLQLRRLADLQFSSIKKDLYAQEKVFLDVFSAKSPKEKVLIAEPFSFVLKLGSSSKKFLVNKYAYTHAHEKNLFLIRIVIEFSSENTKHKKSRFIYQLAVSVQKSSVKFSVGFS